tara:strand:+ start:3835 stop:4029 length:195 start_codon:yes stop_codon:yes gene_type:complete
MGPELVLGSERVTALGLDQELVLVSERELVLESVPGSESVRGLAMALEWGKRFVRVDPFESRQK